MEEANPLTNKETRGIMKAGCENIDTESKARDNILNSTYPSKIIQGRQNKHIVGTKEFVQKQEQLRRTNFGSEPSIINPNIDAQLLVDKYRGTGHIDFANDSRYPIETITADSIIGKTWVISLQKYVDTRVFKIFYSSTGTHIVPVNEIGRV